MIGMRAQAGLALIRAGRLVAVDPGELDVHEDEVGRARVSARPHAFLAGLGLEHPVAGAGSRSRTMRRFSSWSSTTRIRLLMALGHLRARRAPVV